MRGRLDDQSQPADNDGMARHEIRKPMEECAPGSADRCGIPHANARRPRAQRPRRKSTSHRHRAISPFKVNQ
jgi:hypothetical protein